MRDITDKEFEKIYLPFYNNVNDYLNKYIIPDVVVFYLANAYSDSVKYFVVDIKKEIIQCYNKFENKKQKDGFYEYYNKIK